LAVAVADEETCKGTLVVAALPGAAAGGVEVTTTKPPDDDGAAAAGFWSVVAAGLADVARVVFCGPLLVFGGAAFVVCCG
jgi:hypothetical protein